MKITKSSIRTIVRRTLKEADTKYDWQKAPGRDAYSWAKDVPTAKPGASMMDAGDLLHAVADSVKKQDKSPLPFLQIAQKCLMDLRHLTSLTCMQAC